MRIAWSSLPLLALVAAITSCNEQLPQVAPPDAGPPDATRSDAATRDQATDLPYGPEAGNADGSGLDGLVLVDAFSDADQGGVACSASGQACDDTDFCRIPDGCPTGKVGQCERRPLFCRKLQQPVCGCDGRTYDNRCTANRNGRNVLHEGPCVCDALSLEYRAVIREAKRCDPSSSNIPCSFAVSDELVCGCPTSVNEIEPKLEELREQWKEEGCDSDVWACPVCPPVDYDRAECVTEGSHTQGYCVDPS
jgi:hypothetical protein